MNNEIINNRFNELSWEIEKFPASHLQTKICLMVMDLRKEILEMISLYDYCGNVSDKANEILKARINELEQRDEVWRNKYAIVQNDLARAFETIEKLEGRIVID